MVCDISMCAVTCWYLVTASVAYLVSYFIYDVLDLPLVEGQTEPSSPSDAHFELRKMLQKILDEVAKLPGLLNHSGFPLRPEEHLPYFSPKKYEQLLATAVLNKVVEDYRNPKNFEHVKPEVDKAGPPTTGATSAGSAAATGTTFDINHNKVTGKSLLNEANLRKMSLDKELKEELYGRSLSESDESYLSDYIQKHTVPLPDLSDTTGSGSGPEDDVLSLKSNTTDGTWEENWLFKKRQLKATESSIAMLVPSPTEEVKALIGDKNADEVSDLSEAGSDVEEYDSDSNAKNSTPAESNSSPKKTETSLEDPVEDSLISINSIASNEPAFSEAKNDLLLKDQPSSNETQNNLMDDLISIEPCSIKLEAANPTLIDNKLNPFLSGPESVLIEENNNIVKQEEVETDDIKLMQERIQNMPKQRDVDGNVLYPIGIARTIPIDGHSTECDRKEVPIDRAISNPEHTAKPSVTESEKCVVYPSSIGSSNLNPITNPSQSNMESKSSTTNHSIDHNLEPKAPEPLSPHPIALNITEIFEISMKPPLMSISEEDLESNASTAFKSILSPSDSITSTADESDFKTLSQNDSEETTNTATADTDASIILDSLTSQPSFDSSVESNPYQREDEFNSITNDNEVAETSEKSLDLLELNETSSDAVYVCDKSQLQFAEQLKEIRHQQEQELQKAEQKEKQNEIDKSEKIHVGQDLVSFNKNAPSPDEMTNQSNEILNHCKEIEESDRISSPSNNESFVEKSSKPMENEVDIKRELLEEQCSVAQKCIAPTDAMSAIDNHKSISEGSDVQPSLMDAEPKLEEDISPEAVSQNQLHDTITPITLSDNLTVPAREVVEGPSENGTKIAASSECAQKQSETLPIFTDTTNESYPKQDVCNLNDLEHTVQKLSSSSETTTSSVDSVVDLEIPKLQQPDSNEKICVSSLHDLPDILSDSAEALNESDNELLKYCQSGSSSPTDTSTEAVAGSVDRVSSPEDSYTTSLTTAHHQIHDMNSEELFGSNGIPTPDEQPHSTPIAVVTQQMRQYCEELKGILYPPKIPELPTQTTEVQPQIPENLEALQIFQEELRVANEDPSQVEITACKDHPIQTISTDSPKTPVSESLPTPMEDFAIRSAEYNHSLRKMDYVEESIPIAEDATCLLKEDLELSNTKEIVTVTPAVEEHAVQEAIIVEHTPTPEPMATVEISYERQITTPVDELEVDRNSSLQDVGKPAESSTSIDSEKEDNIISPSVVPESTADREGSHIDTEVSSLSVGLQTVCVLTNIDGTNLTSMADSDGKLTDEQTPTFITEQSMPIQEADSYLNCPQIPAQSEPEQQIASEKSNGHVPGEITNGGSTDESVEDEMLIPGSIAEREHLKWRNASPIANNPYSPDVLQKRLEESNRKSSMFDFDRLAGRDPTSPVLEVPDDPEPVVSTKDDEETAEKDRSLQSVLGSNPNQYQRYGRDYYINDAKRASGSRKQTPDLPAQLTHSTDDEKQSLLLSQKQDQPTSATPHCHQLNELQPTAPFPCVKSSSCGDVTQGKQNEDIFSAARPIEVAPDDPILKKGSKLEYLSTPTREIYLVPADEPTTPHSLGSSSEVSMTSRADDSLTYSEDSDVTRIYEIGSGESKVIHGDVISTGKDISQTPPSTPINEEQSSDVTHSIDQEQAMNKLNTLKQQESEVLSEEIVEIIPQIKAPRPMDPESIPEEPSSPTIDRSHLLKPHLLKNKPLSPETIKFFSPKKPFTANLAASSSLSQSSVDMRDLPHHSTGSHYHSSLHIDYPPSRPTAVHHDFIIEKEVMEVLPSVKELAKCYSGSQQDVSTVPKPLHKPRVKLRKDFIRQSSDMLHKESDQETRSGMPNVENKNRRMYCSTSSILAAEENRENRRINVEAYNPPTFVPMAPGHSITARSLSKQIRDELKINATDDHKVQGGHTSPERPSSPVFAPGHLRKSIHFFENLSNK